MCGSRSVCLVFETKVPQNPFDIFLYVFFNSHRTKKGEDVLQKIPQPLGDYVWEYYIFVRCESICS